MITNYPLIIHETLQYKNIDEKLKFVHITKTSGTYIEELGKQQNLNWGKYDKYLGMAKLPKTLSILNSPYWHLPLQFFDKYPYKKYTKLFTIVRNPYDRIISECLCKYGGKFSKNMETNEDLNIYINQQVNKKKTLDLSFYHFLPQNLYTHNEKGEQVIDIIIKYEEIDKFNDLMKQYSIDINYIKKKRERKFDIKDISRENITLINEVYDLDFIYYNYEKL
uniref:Sulfotransferase domain-containing protein n=1 Tax=viral metagenome TaxID=1070528 RepID=A0A6C0F9V5_9ZZZZ|tara:strand:- start:25453 stop:26118 length:666 start_codon:yes stop_codon:yes gene_type:complete